MQWKCKWASIVVVLVITFGQSGTVTARCGVSSPSPSCSHLAIVDSRQYSILELSKFTLGKIQKEVGTHDNKVSAAIDNAIRNMTSENINRVGFIFDWNPISGISKNTNCELFKFSGPRSLEMGEELKTFGLDPDDCTEEAIWLWTYLNSEIDIRNGMEKLGYNDRIFDDLNDDEKLSVLEHASFTRTILGNSYHGNYVPDLMLAHLALPYVIERLPIYEIEQGDSYWDISDRITGKGEDFVDLWKMNQSVVAAMSSYGGSVQTEEVAYIVAKGGTGELLREKGFGSLGKKRFVTNINNPAKLIKGDQIILPLVINQWVSVDFTNKTVEDITLDLYGVSDLTPLVEEYCGYLIRGERTGLGSCVLPVLDDPVTAAATLFK